MKKINYLIIVLFITSICSCFAQKQKSLQIEAQIKAVCASENVPAISVGILINGEKQFINTGYFDRTKRRRVTEESIYQIASLGKMFIGIIVHNLVLEHKVSLGQSITDFLPSTYSEKTIEKLNSITIGQLLHHQSGLPRDVKSGYKRKDGNSFLYDYTEADFENELSKVKIKKKGEFHYSNFGFGLLAYLMENATGTGYEELLAKYITLPHQMTNTTMTLTGNQTAELVTPYRKDNRDIETEPWRMGKMAPPSATYSTTEDLLKLIEKQLIAQVKYNTSQKTSPLVLSEHNIPLAEGATVSYGYGLFIGSNGYYGHGGDMDGYGSEYSFSVKNNHALVLLTSSGGKWVPKLILAINEILNKD